MESDFRMEPVGVVRLEGEKAFIDIHPPYVEALLGLEDFSHLMVFWWFHRNDTPEKRATLRVHPRKDPANPLRGVFATHAPMRPNLVALSFCRNLSIVKSRIFIDGIDAFDGTPVIDIKPYIPVEDLAPGGVSVPDWV
jgi:tRNA-Thr(GGU) m(6)t(6)A37 methyltransferase TsaA